VLNLAAETDPSWVERALAHVDEILLDHAHCEKKAAGAAVNLLFRYPHLPSLQAPLARLAREELEHFEAVLERLAARGIAFARQRPGPYGGRLHALVRAPEPAHLIDVLLVCALIEARSCERFKLLAAALPDPQLAAFYRTLLAAEARHHQLYVDLACTLAPAAEVRSRLHDLARAEAEILATPPPGYLGARLHT
jgi:tRNA-(ms[2]io[6]A)-hydroxylase